MATINLKILEAGYKEGYINPCPLTENQKLILHQSIITASKILQIIRKEEDLDIEQISYRANLDRNTCLIYCRWLESKKLIRKIPWEAEGVNGRRIRNLYLAKTPKTQ